MLNFGNPTGSLVSEERKRYLIDLLARHDVPLIEDDVYNELYFGPQPPMCSKAVAKADHVMHISSFSKCLAPGYRLGWVAAGRYAEKIVRLKLATTLATTTPVQIAVADYLKHGGYDHHLRRLRQQLQVQESLLLEGVERAFPGTTRLARPAGGYFVWLELPESVDALKLHRMALDQGISIAPGPIFSAKKEFKNCIRLNFGHPQTEAMQRAVATLGHLVSTLS